MDPQNKQRECQSTEPQHSEYKLRLVVNGNRGTITINWLEGPIDALYRVSIKSFPDYERLLQENCVEYKHIFLM